MAIALRKSERKTTRYILWSRARISFHPYHNHHKSVCIKRLYIASGRVPRGPQRLLYGIAAEATTTADGVHCTRQ